MPKLQRVENALLFLTLLFLPTQLGKHFWPDFSYIYSLKIDYLSPALYFWDILVTGLLLVWILRKPSFNRFALNLLLFFLLTQGLSLFKAANIGAGLIKLEQYLLAGLLGVYLASLDLKKIATSSVQGGLLAMTNTGCIYLPLVLGITIESGIAILQFFAGSTLGLWVLGERTFNISTSGIAKFDFYGMQFLRPYATFPHPNVLAGYMLLVIVILNFFPRHYILRLRFRMTILKISTFLAGLTIFLTMSRTAIVAGLISVVVLARRKPIIIITFIIIIILSPILFTRYSSLLNFDNLTLIRREELIGNAWQMFLKSPVFGIGLNNFIPAVASNLITGPSRFLQPVHNIFLLVLSETGIIGLIGLISLIGYPVLSSLRRQGPIKNYLYRSRIKYGMTVSGWILLPWFIIFFLGMFDHYFLTLPQGIRLLFLVWGLSFSMLK